jgi:hypothetical protein
MAFFTTDQLARLSAGVVRMATLVEFMFLNEADASLPIRLWNGTGLLTAGGHTWDGFAGLGSISGLEETRGAVSQQATFTLSGVAADIAAAALQESDKVQGRDANVYLQFFDADWQVVGSPVPVWAGQMQPPRITRTSIADDGGAARTVNLPAENVFFKRSRVPAGRYTDREQQSRHPGDKACSLTPTLPGRRIVWPNT